LTGLAAGTTVRSMRPGLLLATVLAATVLVAPPPAPAASGARGLLPEYAVLVSAIGVGLQAAKPIYSCRGPDLLAITEALKGPEEVQHIGNEAVAQSLGSREQPWPRNRRTFSINGRHVKPDFVKSRSFVQTETARGLDLTPELRDLHAIARRRGGDLVVVTRKTAALSPALVAAAKQSFRRKVGRLRVVRCI
jgi:hypothetical protein